MVYLLGDPDGRQSRVLKDESWVARSCPPATSTGALCGLELRAAKGGVLGRGPYWSRSRITPASAPCDRLSFSARSPTTTGQCGRLRARPPSAPSLIRRT